MSGILDIDFYLEKRFRAFGIYYNDNGIQQRQLLTIHNPNRLV